MFALRRRSEHVGAVDRHACSDGEEAGIGGALLPDWAATDTSHGRAASTGRHGHGQGRLLVCSVQHLPLGLPARHAQSWFACSPLVLLQAFIVSLVDVLAQL